MTQISWSVMRNVKNFGQIKPFSEIHKFSIKLNRTEFIAFCNNKLKNKAQMHIEGVKIKQVHKMKFEVC